MSAWRGTALDYRVEIALGHGPADAQDDLVWIDVTNRLADAASPPRVSAVRGRDWRAPITPGAMPLRAVDVDGWWRELGGLLAPGTPVRLVATRGPTPPIDPSPPVASSCVAMWWADDLIGSVADGDPVDVWTDRVGSLDVTASGSTRPTLAAAGLAGQPAVAFDGLDDRLARSGRLFPADQGCVVAVATLAAPGAGTSIWSEASTTNPNRYTIGTTAATAEPEVQVRTSSEINTVRGHQPVASNSPAIIEWSSTGNAYELRLNGIAQSSSVSSGTNSGAWGTDIDEVDNWSIGALGRSSPQSFFAGQIAFLAAYDAPLSAAQRFRIHEWIAGRYG